VHKRRLIARQLTLRLIRIYERDVETRRRDAAPYLVEQIIVFHAVVPRCTSDAEGARASARKKPDIVVVVESEDETQSEVR
jgi:hypothetical protein